MGVVGGARENETHRNNRANISEVSCRLYYQFYAMYS
jgi:hypothetical protein